MTRVALVAAGLLAIWLLVLTSAAPGDLLVGGVLSVLLAVVLRPRGVAAGPGLASRVAGAAGLAGQTAWEMVRGSWRVVRLCLGAPSAPGYVEIPRGARSEDAVALWGVLTGEAPDEIPVDIDDERGVLIVHLIDMGDPAAVRARHARTYERWMRRVVP